MTHTIKEDLKFLNSKPKGLKPYMMQTVAYVENDGTEVLFDKFVFDAKDDNDADKKQFFGHDVTTTTIEKTCDFVKQPKMKEHTIYTMNILDK